MDHEGAEKLRFTMQTGGWIEFQAMLQERLAHYNRLLIAQPEQRTAGYIEALMFVLGWPRMALAEHDEERLVKPPGEPASIGDPYRETANS